MRRKWALVLWAMWIFATSCTVVARDLFIRWVQRHLPGAAKALWSEGWLRFGIVVVKMYHVSEFAFLCVLATGALRACNLKWERALILGALGCLAYAASDEWHQTFVPGRGGTWVDVCIDALGIGLASLWIVRRARREVAPDVTAR